MNEIIKFCKRGGFLFLILCVTLVMNHNFGYITMVGVFSILVFCVITIREKIDVGVTTIILYSFFYILFSSISGINYSVSTLVLYAIAPFIFYQYGGKLVKNYVNEYHIITAWLIIIICYCIDVFYVSYGNIVASGSIINASRSLAFADDMIKVSATLVGLPLSIGMIGFPMTLIIKNKFAKICFFTLSVLSLISVFSLLNRTGIVVAVLCFVIVVGYKSLKNINFLFSSIFLIAILLIVLWYSDIISSDLIEIYNERNAEDIATLGSRTFRWKNAFHNLLDYPFGWIRYRNTNYVHNMWLDVARISGIIPFSILTYMAIDCFLKAFKLIKRYNNSLSYMLLGLNVCFFASCFVEPIYGGTHFLLYCMLWGTENTILKERRKML